MCVCFSSSGTSGVFFSWVLQGLEGDVGILLLLDQLPGRWLLLLHRVVPVHAVQHQPPRVSKKKFRHKELVGVSIKCGCELCLVVVFVVARRVDVNNECNCGRGRKGVALSSWALMVGQTSSLGDLQAMAIRLTDWPRKKIK